MKKKPVIGVLALQGCVDRHRPHIEAAGGEFRAVKTAADFDAVDAFILPGGESTTMLKLIDVFGLWEPLVRNFAKKPVWGICAGSILMADKVYVDAAKTLAQKSFGLLPITIVRNGYGRQLDSHTAEVDGFEVSFIRAPVFEAVANDVNVRAVHGGKPAWVAKGPYMASAFHPELTMNYPSPMHRAFVEMAKAA
ncbi:MAG: pyridoxal 5'-phosphate synthase glutaminase subunit PdxT [Alphaproteobacteria bacterium]|nr:pyridoxal 5'-phosphate synthase glutaminase subunit PdxT [Alphaproteobacteria bacterium]